MCERLVGLSLKQALEVRKKFEQLVVSGKEDDELLKLNRLVDVSRMPARANCAKLAWKILD
jgi:NifU-like protein involved in Fe-S cluster formation